MTDRILYILVALCMTIGLIASFSLSAYIAMANGVGMFHFVMIQGLSCFLGLLLMLVISRLAPEKLSFIGFSLFFIFLGLMILMPWLPESIVPTVNGAKRWIRIGGFSLSPVEFFKIGFVWFLAWSFTRRFSVTEGESRHWKEELMIFAPYGIVLALVLFLIVVLQNDLGQAIVLLGVLLIMLFFIGTSLKLFFILLAGASGIALIFLTSSTYRLGKVKQWWAGVQDTILTYLPDTMANFLRISNTTIDQGFQVTQSLHAIHNGGILGEGLGNGIYKLGFVSDVHTDFVLAGLIEETGLIGAVVIAFLMLILVFRIFKIANRSDNQVYHLFTVGVGMIFMLQFMMNSLGITGVVPLKGITLPFISYGGSSVIALSIAIGMVLSISKKAKL